MGASFSEKLMDRSVFDSGDNARIEHRSSSYWIDGRNGRMPWGWPRLLLFAALPLFLLLALFATPWAVRHIEGQLVDEARDDLSAAGIDPAGLDIDFDYRDGDATGVLPAGVTAADAEAVVDDGLLRDFDVTAEVVAAPVEREEEPVPATGPVEVDVRSDGSTVTLTGTVLDEGQRETVVDAAERVLGPSVMIDDQLTVTGLEPAVVGADARVAGLAAAIGTLGGAETWRATLTDEALDIEAQARGQAVGSIEALDGLDDPVRTTAAVDDLGPVEDPADVAVSSLQEELDELIPEIRANVVFASGSDVLTPTAQATLDKVVAAMEEYPGPVVTVAGHTDDVGDRAANVALSESRAASVAEYLVAQGVDGARLQSTGFGPDEPIESNDSAEGRALNRRVELTAMENFG